MGYSLGDLLDGVATVVDPEGPALMHGDRVTSWKDIDQRSNNLAKALLDQGIVAGDKAAVYMRNCP